MAEGGNTDLIIFDEDGFDKDGYDKDGYDKYGYDKDGKLFEQSEGENIKNFSKGRETRRPFKPRKRTSTRKDVSFSNPSYIPDDGWMETSFGGDKLLHSSKDPRVELNNELRASVKRIFPRMTNSVQVDQIDGRLSVRLFGDEKWSSVYNKNGNISLQFNKDLQKALGFNKEKIIKENDEQNSKDLARIVELEKDLEREDISEEVRNTTINEINELKDAVVERNQENERIQNQTLLRDRIKAIFKKIWFFNYNRCNSRWGCEWRHCF